MISCSKGSILLRTLLFIGGICVCLSALAAPTPEIHVEGGSKALRENVRQYLTLADEPCSAPLWRLKSLLIDAEDEIQNAAQALGYYQLSFVPNLTQANGCWQLVLRLTPGEQVKVTELNLAIRGDEFADEIFKPLLDNPEIRVGDGLNHGSYENLKSRITTFAAGHGYFDGRFDVSRVTVNSTNNTANIELIYNTGVRYRIGEIRMSHNILSENFLRLYLNIQSGDFYDADKLLELKSFYNASNYFAVSTASPDLQNLHDHLVDISIELEERKRFAYSIGAGVSTDTGPRVLLGFENRYVNDAGHSLNADVSQSNIKSSAQIGYTIPMSRPSYEFVKIYTGIDKEETDTLYSNKKTLGASYTYYQKNNWLHTYALNIENEDSRVGDDAGKFTHLLIPSVTFSRTQTDGNPYPLMGWSLMAKLSGSPKTFGSDVSYEQLYVRAKYIHAFSYGRVLLRSELGLTDVNDTGDLPASVRFFAGGGSSVRGYDYKSLGPEIRPCPLKKAESCVVGGNNLLVNSVEYDYQFRPSWAVAAFFDAGNAANDFNLDLKRGLGLGLRWISPIGPVRFDVARGLDAPKGWNFHISMGPDL
jgi:translocation and assembly module TamA